MKTNRFTIFLSLIGMLFAVSCGLDEVPTYDLKFVHIMNDNASEINVSAKANTVGTYNVYLSSKETKEEVNVTYEIIIGSGLKENVDYKILTKGNTITFLPGIYDMPIRIQWLANPVDKAKDNTIKIKLISSDQNYNIGLPGPDKKQSEFKITKI